MIPEILLLAPEIVLLTMACIILILDTVIVDEDKALTYWFSQATLAVVAFLVVWLSPATETIAFSGHFVTDPMSVVLKAAIAF